MTSIADDLRALAAKCDGEPVYWVDSIPKSALWTFEMSTRETNVCNIPLYTAPPAPANVPDKTEQEDEWNPCDFTRGWNACRAEMLRTAPPSVPDRDAVDAARYRWLRDHWHGFNHYRVKLSGVRPLSIDEEVDREMARALKSEPQG